MKRTENTNVTVNKNLMDAVVKASMDWATLHPTTLAEKISNELIDSNFAIVKKGWYFINFTRVDEDNTGGNIENITTVHAGAFNYPCKIMGSLNGNSNSLILIGVKEKPFEKWLLHIDESKYFHMVGTIHNGELYLEEMDDDEYISRVL